MLGKVLALSTLCAFAILSALLHTTTPSSIHPVGILLVFVLIYVLALGVLTFLLYGVVHTVARVTAKGRFRAKTAMTLQRAYLYASVLALAPVMLIGMRSIGQSGVYEVALVVLFEIVACFYITKQR